MGLPGRPSQEDASRVTVCSLSSWGQHVRVLVPRFPPASVPPWTASARARMTSFRSPAGEAEAEAGAPGTPEPCSRSAEGAPEPRCGCPRRRRLHALARRTGSRDLLTFPLHPGPPSAGPSHLRQGGAQPPWPGHKRRTSRLGALCPTPVGRAQGPGRTNQDAPCPPQRRPQVSPSAPAQRPLSARPRVLGSVCGTHWQRGGLPWAPRPPRPPGS